MIDFPERLVLQLHSPIPLRDALIDLSLVQSDDEQDQGFRQCRDPERPHHFAVFEGEAPPVRYDEEPDHHLRGYEGEESASPAGSHGGQNDGEEIQGVRSAFASDLIERHAKTDHRPGDQKGHADLNEWPGAVTNTAGQARMENFTNDPPP